MKKNRIFKKVSIAMIIFSIVLSGVVLFQLKIYNNSVLEIYARQQDQYIKLVLDQINIRESESDVDEKSIKAVFKPDKGHLHHKLVAKGFTQKQAVLILYGLSASLGMFAIILFDSGIWKALSFLLMIIAAVALGYRNFIKEKQTKPKMIDNK